MSAPDRLVARDRQSRMLRTAMGPQIAAALSDPDVIEVMLNPCGALWLDRRGGGRVATGQVAVIIIIVTGLTLAFGDTAGGFRRLVQIVFGLSIAFAASSFFLTFFQFGGGAVV